MSTNPLRRGRPTLVAALLLAVGLAGCGGGYYDDYYGGTLQVTNDITSFETIEYVNAWVSGGPIETFAMFLLPGETDFIDFYPDTYEMELEWSDGFVEYFPFVDIFDDETTLLVGVN